MGRILTRLAGIALVTAGVAGLIFCVVGLFVLARVEQRVESVVMEQLELFEQALATTAEGLVLAETSLEQASVTLVSLADTAEGAGQAVNGTVPTVDAVSELLGEQLPATLETTQATLNTAARNAKLVDDVLFALTTVPLLEIGQYNPDVPLQQGLEQVAASLDEFAPSLRKARRGLNSASGDFEGLSENLTDFTGGDFVAVVIDNLHLNIGHWFANRGKPLQPFLLLLISSGNDMVFRTQGSNS